MTLSLWLPPNGIVAPAPATLGSARRRRSASFVKATSAASVEVVGRAGVLADVGPRALIPVAHQRDAICVRKWQRPEQHVVDDREQRRVRPDAHRERQRGRKGECSLHSVRSAMHGSTRAARQAGTRLASAETVRMMTAAEIHDSGSPAATPYNARETASAAATAKTQPAPRPATATTSPCRITLPRTADGRAPSAIRMPISRVRLATE